MAERDGIVNAKARLRREILDGLARLSPDERLAAGILVTRHLVRLIPVAEADTIMVFLSMPTEVDTWPLIRWAWRCGKRIAVPRLGRNTPNAEAGARVQSMAAVHLPPAGAARAAGHPAVRPGAFGILTVPDAPVVPTGDIDVVLVPCVAVDRRGNRLGRGGGYYDRFLSQPDLRAARIVPAFRPQVVDHVPTDERDVPVDMVVTAGEVLRFER
ncbi:MAG: 5-formyltetrahydrofolate cyclo-ligase [Planctomycetes bacterium]|nr:5-formyltetrahydrofolate cyclo-ligase [Planctomycetota bacterium]